MNTYMILELYEKSEFVFAESKHIYIYYIHMYTYMFLELYEKSEFVFAERIQIDIYIYIYICIYI